MLAGIYSHTAEVLESEIGVFVELRILQPRREIRWTAGIRSKEFHGGMKPDLADGFRDRRVLLRSSRS